MRYSSRNTGPDYLSMARKGGHHKGLTLLCVLIVYSHLLPGKLATNQHVLVITMLSSLDNGHKKVTIILLYSIN